MGPGSSLGWPEVADRLAGERTCWLTTVAGDGSPHPVPVWVAAVEGELWVFTGRETAKARHLAQDPRVSLHLPDGERVVIAHGRMEDAGRPAGRPSVCAAFARKYDHPGDADYLPPAAPGVDVLYRFVPERALVWDLEAFEGSQRRWRAAGRPSRSDEPA